MLTLKKGYKSSEFIYQNQNCLKVQLILCSSFDVSNIIIFVLINFNFLKNIANIVIPLNIGTALPLHT